MSNIWYYKSTTTGGVYGVKKDQNVDNLIFQMQHLKTEGQLKSLKRKWKFFLNFYWVGRKFQEIKGK